MPLNQPSDDIGVAPVTDSQWEHSLSTEAIEPCRVGSRAVRIIACSEVPGAVEKMACATGKRVSAKPWSGKFKPGNVVPGHFSGQIDDGPLAPTEARTDCRRTNSQAMLSVLQGHFSVPM